MVLGVYKLLSYDRKDDSAPSQGETPSIHPPFFGHWHRLHRHSCSWPAHPSLTSIAVIDVFIDAVLVVTTQ